MGIGQFRNHDSPLCRPILSKQMFTALHQLVLVMLPPLVLAGDAMLVLMRPMVLNADADTLAGLARDKHPR
jgi:hypothetical protein